jgi:hypothetical protein
MPLSTSSFAGDGIPPSKTQVPNPSAEERTPDIVTYFVLEVEFFLQCTETLRLEQPQIFIFIEFTAFFISYLAPVPASYFWISQ